MVVLDIETTGLDPLKHSIIEIGALDFNNPTNQFYKKCRVFEGAAIDEKALMVNGSNYTELLNLNRMSLEELIIDFIDWIKEIDDRTIAGHNVNFDINFLNESLKRFEIKWNFGWRKIDQHTLTYAHLLKTNKIPPLKNGFSNLNGDEIMNYVGLPNEPKPHKGINGAKYEAEAMSRIIYGKGVLLEFNKFDIPIYLLNKNS